MIASEDTHFNPAYWVAGTSGTGKYTFKTAVYNTTSSVPYNIVFEGLGAGSTGNLTVLTAPGPLSSNVLGAEDVVKETVTSVTADANGAFGFVLEQWSVAVLTT